MSRSTDWLRGRSRLALVAGLAGTAALALATTASLGGFTASITNNANTTGTGSLVMQEAVGSGPTTTCLSTGTGTTGSNTVNSSNANATCPGNKFGALSNAKPGDSNATNVVISNVGTITASSLTMSVGACTQAHNTANSNTYFGSDTGFCGKVDVTVEDDTVSGTPRCVFPAGAGACPALSSANTLTSLATSFAAPTSILPASTTVAAGAARTYKVTAGIDSGADNSDQGLTATQPITFAFAQ